MSSEAIKHNKKKKKWTSRGRKGLWQASEALAFG
jgi:hypothetical protein